MLHHTAPYYDVITAGISLIPLMPLIDHPVEGVIDAAFDKYLPLPKEWQHTGHAEHDKYDEAAGTAEATPAPAAAASAPEAPAPAPAAVATEEVKKEQ